VQDNTIARFISSCGAVLRNPELRQKLVTEKDPNTTGMFLLYQSALVWDRTYPMGQPLSYEPDSKNSIAAIARREGRSPREVVYNSCSNRTDAPFSCMPLPGIQRATPPAFARR